MLILALVASLHATAPATAPVAVPQDPPAEVLRLFPLRNLHGFKTRPEIPRLGSQLEDPSPGSQALVDYSRPPAGLKIDQIVEIVGMSRREAWEEGDLGLDVHDGVLFATGPAADVEGVGRVLRALEDSVGAGIDVELHILPWTSEQPPPARLDPAATDAFLTAHTPTWSGRSRLRAGDLRALGHSTWTPYVRDYEVEVAQKASIGDPWVRKFFEGLMLTVEVHTLSQRQELAMLGQFAFGELQGPIESRTTGVKKMPAIDTPVLASASGTLSGRFESGGGLVLGFGGSAPGPNIAILLRATSHPAGIEEADREGPQYIPISALTSRSLAGAYDDLFHHNDNSGWPESIAGGQAVIYGAARMIHLEPLSLGVIEELVRIRHPALDEDEGASLLTLNEGLFVFGDSQLVGQIRQLVAALEDRYLTTSTLRFEVGGSGQPEWWVTAPALHNRRHCLFSGRETTVIGDYQVEIAQKSGVSNPVVRDLFTGVAINFAIYSGPGQPTLDLMGTVNAASEPAYRPSQSTDIGHLQTPMEARTTVHCMRPFEAGRPIDLGNGPVHSWLPAGARVPTTISVTVQ